MFQYRLAQVQPQQLEIHKCNTSFRFSLKWPFLAVGNPNSNYLPSSAIPTHQLRNVDDVIAQHRNLLHEDSAGTLCQILAKEAIFGKDLLLQCTVTGKGGTLALPVNEMNNLKKKIFPKYHNSPEQFEPTWKKCTTATEQACRRLRREKQEGQIES